MKRFEFMIRGAITALAGFGVLAIGPAAQAQSVSVNSAQVCVSAPSLTMDPAGNLNITCTPVSTGGGGTVPSCTVSSPTITWTATATAGITASCTGAPTSFAWTNMDTAPGVTGLATAAVTAGPFPAPTTAPLTYRFSLIANNATGPSASAQGALTVNPAATGGGGTGTCTTTAVNGSMTDSFAQVNPGIPRGGSVSYALPVFAAAGVGARPFLRFDSAQDTRSQSNLQTQFSVSACPGDFSVAAACRAVGVADTGSTSMYALSGSGTNGCYMTPGTQYYFNVRNVGADLSTPSCNVGTCFMVVQMHSGSY